MKFVARFVLMLALWVGGLPAFAQIAGSEPVGELSSIEMAIGRRAVERMAGESEPDSRQAMADVVAHPELYQPPVLYVLAHYLFAEGRKDEAGFWVYAAQLRTQFDSDRSAYPATATALTTLNVNFAVAINRYMFADLPKLEATVQRVLDWDSKTPYRYDQRWINVYGDNAQLLDLKSVALNPSVSLVFSRPKSEWAAIAQRTRRDYLSGFQEALAELKAKKE